ncbi:MAG: hypothetical protein ROZ64_15970 [Burkholderiaceae bacterium]|jgi:hypothetical protein|nr:hypothetical protein [Burkholderiaceae bacterium]
MAASHTVLFTAMPRGVVANPATLPVSVLVSPRLVGADRLGAYPDWVDWTSKLKAGARLVFRCDGRTARVAIDTASLRPDLWRALFDESTFVRSRKFDDYSAHGVMSFSVRDTLSALKTVYQEAGVVLALPDAPDDSDPNDPDSERHRAGRPERTPNRQRLAGILRGLDVHWNRDNAKALRAHARHRALSGTGQHALNGPLDGEGLITAARNPAAFASIAGPFSAYHHMPTPTEQEAGAVAIDPDTFDFHQALSALEAHPQLQRALGLVFDVELPRDLVPASATGTPAPLSVDSTDIAWQMPPSSPALQTACMHFASAGFSLFHAASRTQTKEGSPVQVIGLLNLDPARFGLAQVDVDGAMHKAIATAEIHNNADPGRSVRPADPDAAPNPEVYDPEATLPSLRSGGWQLYLDGRGAATVDAIGQSKAFNQALESAGAQPRPFYAEDLVRGYRLDVWESRTKAWHSLHRRAGRYEIGDDRIVLDTEDEEGFLQLAATQPAPGADADKDLYVHEVIARWAGWSLSVPFPGKALSRYGSAEDAVPPDGDDPKFRTDEPLTAFKVRTTYKVVPATLPRLRFGSRYRIRARAVDLAGNSLRADDAIVDALSRAMALPRDADGLPWLRWEPVAAPLVVIRDEAAVTGPGSAVHRLVMRTFNDAPQKDDDPADLGASDRHIVPPRTSVELGERMGMFDRADGRLDGDPAVWNLAVARDEGHLNRRTFDIAGKTAKDVPIEPPDSIDALPYLPDPLARGAAIRDLPGSTDAAVGRASPADAAEGSVAYAKLVDVNPRPGSATLVSFNAGNDWQQTTGFRLALAEPTAANPRGAPHWDPHARVLTVCLPKGTTAVVPLSSYLNLPDLELMGQWRWLSEFVNVAAIFGAQPAHLLPGQSVDLIAHVLQRAVEGGHWMLCPPTLLTLVHAVQQPLGRPAFAALNVEQSDSGTGYGLQLDRMRGRTDPQELAPITARRRLGETSAYLMGAIRIHGASTMKIDLRAEWVDPFDLPHEDAPDRLAMGERRFESPVDELPLPGVRERYLVAPGAGKRLVGYYDPEHDQIAMVCAGEHTGRASTFQKYFRDASPKHELGDTRRHRVRYTAVATSRYKEYFEPGDGGALDFTRTSEPVLVDVPASARPLAPGVVYVVPTFGWQRQSETSMKRSVRYGGGLRVYLERGWYSSGVGELLGVTLWNGANGALDDAARERFKPYFTQWGMDPIWKTAALSRAPRIEHFPDAVASDRNVSLEEAGARHPGGEPGVVDVVGFEPQFDEERSLWFADLTIDLSAGPDEFLSKSTYAPFVRLALVRYQPHALDDARISRVVLAGFAQLTPDRAAMVTADPYHRRALRVVVSGVAPSGPPPAGPAHDKPARPTHVGVRVQKRAGSGDLDWQDSPPSEATVTQLYEGQGIGQPNLELWIGYVTFATAPAPGAYRLLVEEHEYVSANYADERRAPGRLIYAETFEVDAALLGA